MRKTKTTKKTSNKMKTTTEAAKMAGTDETTKATSTHEIMTTKATVGVKKNENSKRHNCRRARRHWRRQLHSRQALNVAACDAHWHCANGAFIRGRAQVLFLRWHTRKLRCSARRPNEPGGRAPNAAV